jgi:hypothetical protein
VIGAGRIMGFPVHTCQPWNQVPCRPDFKLSYFALQNIFGEMTKAANTAISGPVVLWVRTSLAVRFDDNKGSGCGADLATVTGRRPGRLPKYGPLRISIGTPAKTVSRYAL